MYQALFLTNISHANMFVCLASKLLIDLIIFLISSLFFSLIFIFLSLLKSARCTKSMNHDRDGIPHHSSINCKYQHQFNNQIFYCQHCFNRGENKIVIPKVTSSKDQSWMGLVTYAWSGYILECKQCGIIYRSRQYWFGNKDPTESCITTRIHHVRKFCSILIG